MNKLKILLIDANEADTEFFTKILEGSAVTTQLSKAKSGYEAFSFLKRDFKDNVLPDIIIADLNVPMINGRHVVEIIKTNEYFLHIPIIIFTSSNFSTDIERAYDSLANCFINKPTQSDDFIKRVECIIHFWANVAILPRRKSIQNICHELVRC